MDAQELRQTLLQAVFAATTEITAARTGAANGFEYAELTGKLDILTTLTSYLTKLDVNKPAQPAEVAVPAEAPAPKKAKPKKST